MTSFSRSLQTILRINLDGTIEENVGIDYGKAKTYTVGSWLEVWIQQRLWH